MLETKTFSSGYKPGSAPRGAFRGRAPPTHCLCPQEKNVLPQATILPPKESNKPSATGVHFGVCAPPKILLVPPKREQSLVPGRKTRVNAKTKPKISRQDLFFRSSSLNLWSKHRDPHHKIPPFPSRL